MDTTQLFLDPTFWLDTPTFQYPSDLNMEYPIPLSEDLGRRKKTRVRASRACIACRSRHTKCDGVEPVCTKCQVEEKACVYTKSRRGGSGRKVGGSVSEDQVHSGGGGLMRGRERYEGSSPEGTIASASEIIDDGGHFVSRYFEFFHKAHPFILPRRQFLERVQSDPSSLDHLLRVLKYIGALYTPGPQTDTLRRLAHEKLTSHDLPSNGFSVQALLLFSIAIHCSDEYAAAEIYLDKAIDIALSIGLNTSDFALQNAENDAILAESWRRTWWSLYCIDAMFAAISHYPTHRLENNIGTVSLPCEDCAYNSGNIPTPRTLREYDNREFAAEEIVYSSFTYLIDTCRIVSTQQALMHLDHGPSEKALEAADAKFVNWISYLPRCKSEVVTREGVDEVMFLACLVLNVEKLLLHRPHSHLPYSPLETRSKCTPPSISRQSRAIRTLHTAKALEAITASIALFALPAEVLKHSPLVSCALSLNVMALVSACNAVFGAREYEVGRGRIRLGLGALRGLRGVWGMAGRSVGEVVGVARELLGVDGGREEVGEGEGNGDGLGMNLGDGEGLGYVEMLGEEGSADGSGELGFMRFRDLDVGA
ncbi:Zn2/Cys6 DNA-binding protein [Glarea lozoyensis ATCC 20868]|uniref:Zn2/Cys6 DNA-binding protein n=1 Tax=Glarea lozoyensis (strain ATCC 20868 / MF5171) TaxID=1116229 RepID=S3DB75_GLAL2|nr:Zn2/Cys6 DNA-binding protein [Glarea lozoyensis ATCC 20868]EPE35717.1 Zn2/Cys6 DNA-binding protein [Glarea lozoyensis ATCC 20868]